MALRPIITLPDPKLRLISAPLGRVDDALRKLLDDMVETMHEAPGIGLAANPGRRSDPRPRRRPRQEGRAAGSRNSSSTRRSSGPPTNASVYEEGCLSIPEYYEEVERPAKVRARFLDREGKRQEILAEGLLATVLQHEIDHLNGVLFIDYISKLKRDRVVKKFAKMAKRAADAPRPL